MIRAENRKYHYLYKITCVKTKRFYIGIHSTDNLNDGYFGSGKRLWNSINYHGQENHKKEILEFFPNRKILLEKEKEIVNKELLLDNLCMNLVVGGQSGGFIDEKHFSNFQKKGSVIGKKIFIEKLKNDKDFRDRYSETMSNSGKKRHQEGKLNYFTFDWTGRKHSEESKKKMSETAKKTSVGEGNSQFGTMWITKDNQNKKIKKTDLDFYTIEGWTIGRVINNGDTEHKFGKLNKEEVIQIKKLLKDSTIKKNEIAKQFNVTTKTIYYINKGLNWKHIK